MLRTGDILIGDKFRRNESWGNGYVITVVDVDDNNQMVSTVDDNGIVTDMSVETLSANFNQIF